MRSLLQCVSLTVAQETHAHKTIHLSSSVLQQLQQHKQKTILSSVPSRNEGRSHCKVQPDSSGIFCPCGHLGPAHGFRIWVFVSVLSLVCCLLCVACCVVVAVVVVCCECVGQCFDVCVCFRLCHMCCICGVRCAVCFVLSALLPCLARARSEVL